MEGPRVTMSRQNWKTGKFRSGLEQRIDSLLKLHKVKADYEKDTLTYVMPEHHRRYTPDWSMRNSRRIHLEAKGRFTAADRQKMKLVVSQHPNRLFILIFQQNNTLTKKYKTTY